MRYAVVDIGSNTVKIYVYDAVRGERGLDFTQIMCESRTLGLINYVKKGQMSEDGILKLVQTLIDYKRISDNISTDAFICFATASLRNIENVDVVLEKVKMHANVSVDLIDGETEAMLSFEGLKSTVNESLHSGIMIDMGGGSTELIGFVDALAVRAHSMPFGCLSLYRKFVDEIFPEKSELKDIHKFVGKKLSEIDWIKKYGDTTYLVGGTGRAIASIHNEIFKRELTLTNYKISIDEFNYLCDYFKKMKNEEIRLLVRTQPERLHTILPGLAAYKEIIDQIGTKNIVVCTSGIREGYLSRRIAASEE